MYLFKWRLFDNCNFSCSYCINSSPNKQPDDIVPERLIRQAKSLNELIENNKQACELLLIGGEVSILSKDVMESILNEFTSKKIKKFRITTNFSASDEWYLMVEKIAEERKWKFCLNPSYHEEFYDLDRFIEKLIRLNEQMMEIKPEFVITKSNTEMADKFVTSMNENKIKYLVDYDRHVSWTDEERKWQSNPARPRSNLCNTIDTYGMTCSNSLHQLNIRRGILYGSACQARKAIGILGITKTIKKESMVCPRHQCSFCGYLTVTDKDGNDVYTREEI